MERIEINTQTGQKQVIELTQEEVATLQTIEVQRLSQVSYTTKRQAEYPSFIDYLDGVVKGDQAQIDKYIADCQAVKAKYPKG
jgi:hypothetical protein